jgi:hypothetical protein
MSAKEIQLSVAWDFALSLKWFETVTFGKIGTVGMVGDLFQFGFVSVQSKSKAQPFFTCCVTTL